MKPAHNKSDTPMLEPVSREEAFTAAIAAAKRNHPHLIVLQEKRELGDCFALLWRDAAGICTDAARCGVSKYCKEAHEDALSRQHAVLPRVAVEHPRVLAVAPPVSLPSAPAPEPQAPPPPQPKRRRGPAFATERPIDHVVDHLLEELGRPRVLPHGWHPSHLEVEHKRHGRLITSRTPNYLSLLIDGEMCARVNTNAAGRANIEIVSDLVKPLRKIFGHVERIPEGSQKKSRPCTYRVKLQCADADSDELVEKLAGAVRETFHLTEDARG